MANSGASEQDTDAYTVSPIPYWKRVTAGATVLTLGMVLFWIIFVGSLGQYWALAFIELACACWLAWKVYCQSETVELTREDGVLTDAAAIEAARLAAVDEARKASTVVASTSEATLWESSWFIRYPITGLILWGAWALERGGHGALAAAAVIFAGTVAYEIAILIIGLGIASYLYSAISSLPVSVAVIIGAIIIASALRKR